MNHSLLTHRRSSRGGFSLVEFGMVTLILGVALVITIPVVLKSQTEARQLGCASRMSDLAKAVLSYERANQRMPVAGLVGPVQNQIGSYSQNSGAQISWVVLTLPFQDQQERFEAFNFKQSAFEQSDAAIGTVIDALQCPTDNQGVNFFRHRLSNRDFALGNYVAFISPVYGEHEEYLRGALGGFEPGTMDGQRLAEISDGFTNTLMLTEIRRRPFVAGSKFVDPRGSWALPWVASSVLAAGVPNANTGHADPYGLFSNYIPHPDWSPTDTATPNSQVGLIDQIRPCQRPVVAQQQGMPCTGYSGFGVASPRSLHDGGVNMAFVDGRVRFVTNDIDYVLYGNLISTNNGKPVNKLPQQKIFGKAKSRR